MESKYLGKTVREAIDELDSFEAPEGVSVVTMKSDELTSSCPITGQPDYYTLSIEYVPAKLCIESKSLKLYLWSFKEKAMFAEKIAAVICDRVVADIAPLRCKVTTVQKARGGITIETLAEYPKSEA
ncbi:preQ(1) synthase [Pelagicoccus mobilis]|uniref:NADPH-dependent 7-cyano-7-deazaguanine reductase n=1 Tax=Pelagicoccus mobilis TaxID=415221 RepID=A0A934VR57_9BACT|nr:preQ(1) synthase [Pelagicoccus mobilis]MBK1879052.1 preQ(1) synthase [Pelagicoccus mobilis]